MVKVIKKLKKKIKVKKKIAKKAQVVKRAKKKTAIKAKQKTKLKRKLKIRKKIKKVVRKKGGKKKLPIKLERHSNNPIIEPSYYSWESKATFNPTAFEHGGKVHILYRAIGDNDSSAIGYASSYNGLDIEDRPTHAVYHRFGETIKEGMRIDYVSGGGWGGGTEDPRATLIDGTIYMLYVAFDGWGSVRIAMTSIKLEDFKKKRWNWSKPILLSPPGELQKSWVLFPEKIKGKFAILHSISPKVLIDYVSDWSDFDGTKYIKSISHEDRERDVAKTGVRGVGPSPIKTNLGWLVLYHAIEHKDPGRYKLFAMILDSKEPTKILYRSRNSILEPNAIYENEGYKAGVIYSCGAVVKNGTLFVYYGGADKFVCVASIELDELLNSLKKDKTVKLSNNKLLKSI